MSPILAPPNRGYADWQRTENYDTGVEWSVQFTNTTNPEASPVIDVSRFAYLGGSLACTQNSVLVTVLWYADAAATIQLGGRQFALQTGRQNPAQLRIPNLGPFAQVSLATMGGVPYTINGAIIATNRQHPCELIPDQPLLLWIDAQTIPAGATVIDPNGYFAGPAKLLANCSAGSVTIALEWLAPDGTSQPFDQLILTTGTNDFSMLTILPAGAWWLYVFNGGAAQAFSCWITPSLTGAS